MLGHGLWFVGWTGGLDGGLAGLVGCVDNTGLCPQSATHYWAAAVLQSAVGLIRNLLIVSARNLSPVPLPVPQSTYRPPGQPRPAGLVWWLLAS